MSRTEAIRWTIERRGHLFRARCRTHRIVVSTNSASDLVVALNAIVRDRWGHSATWSTDPLDASADAELEQAIRQLTIPR